MYGWINGCLEHLMVDKFGDEVWTKIKANADCEQNEGFIHNVNYADEVTLRLIQSASLLLNITVEALMELFGKHFVVYLTEHGYGSALQCHGNTFREWLMNIDESHRLLKSRFPGASFPEFCTSEDESDPNNLILHYFSVRNGQFAPMVVGIIRGAAKAYFAMDAKMEMIGAEVMPSSGKFHGIWRVFNVDTHQATLLEEDDSSKTSIDCCSRCSSGYNLQLDDLNNGPSSLQCPFSAGLLSSASSSSYLLKESFSSLPKDDQSVSSKAAHKDEPQQHHHQQHHHQQSATGTCLPPKAFCRIFPFHIVIDKQLKIIQVGQNLERFFHEEGIDGIVEVPVHCLFKIVSPDDYHYGWEWSQLPKLCDRNIELRLTLPSSKRVLTFTGEIDFLQDSNNKNSFAQATQVAFLLSPLLKSTQELLDNKLHLHDLPRHTFQRDLLFISEHLKTELNNGLHLTKLSRRLEEEKQRAQTTLQTKRNFVRYVSHEIRTPLNITVLGLGYLEDEFNKSTNDDSMNNTTAAFREVLDDTKDSCNNAVDILNDLLLYEKLDGGFFALSKAIVPFGLFVQEITRSFKLVAKSAGVDFIVTPLHDDFTNITVDMDKAKMHQVLRNLMSNAAKFTQQGGTVTMRCELVSNHGTKDSLLTYDGKAIAFATEGYHALESESSLFVCAHRDIGSVPVVYGRITITDSGPGISAVDQHALFHEFSQVKADKLQNGQGSGLGLWIAASIVKMHGGRIGVMSEGEGFGSSFITDLPIVTSTTRANSVGCHSLKLNSFDSCAAQPEREQQPLSATNYRVLIVDDVASNRKMVRRILRDKFACLDEAENGQEAVDKYLASLLSTEQQSFDIILMDFLMPVLSGPDATTKIKEIAMLYGKAVTVIGITGNGMEHDIAAFLQAGADTVMVKPLNLKLLDDFLLVTSQANNIHDK